MNARGTHHPRVVYASVATGFFAAWIVLCLNLAAEDAPRQPLATVAVVAGRVEFSPAGTARWYAATTNTPLYADDQLRTGADSRATLKLRENAGFPVGPLSQLWLRDRPEGAGMRLMRGVFSFFGRDKPGHYEFEAGGVNMVVRGTEFAIAVREDETAVVTLFDGEMDLGGGAGPPLNLKSGEVATLRPGEAPRRTAVIQAGDWSTVQWALYYPAILDPAELGWTSPPDPALASSWESYRRGNLIQALAQYPADRTAASAAERLYLAALLLSVGNVQKAEPQLERISHEPQLGALALAHQRLAATVLHRSAAPAETGDVESATALLAASYALQAEGRLRSALEKARAATVRSPGFGFAWVRLAELEFSHGNVSRAQDALTKGLALTPENAQGHALHGFTLAAQNRLPEAEAAFQRAMALDGNLANAWLGRGLCRIRRGDLAGGREDLLLAATLEPQRSELRSYLAKAFADSKPFRTPPLAYKAAHELDLARRLDPQDPTPWLYSALLNQQENRVNEAVTDLQRSADLNTNRAVYRSAFLLDQDRAVRSANLANAFADAGMSDAGLHEATRAVNSDYANASAHLFLANSYNALRDRRQVNLRYEAPWFSEFLLGNLLSPVGAGTLSQTVSQNDYSKLFERDGFGVVNETVWTSNGDWLESAAQFGRFGNFEYALDALYRSEVGERPNQDLNQLTLSVQSKWQVGSADTLFLQGIYYDADSGDLAQYYDPASANRLVRLHESQEPVVLAGWNHEWKPGVHTLVLVSPWSDHATLSNPLNTNWVGLGTADGSIHQLPGGKAAPLDYSTRFNGWSAEAQQIWQIEPQVLIGGVRYQSGSFDSSAAIDVSRLYKIPPGESPMRPYGATSDMQRFSAYAYDQWQAFAWALLTAGVVYDHLEAPLNFNLPPLTSDQRTTDKVSPKVGLTLTPWKGATVRGAYTRSLGGVSFDQSYRLEPVQVAGFTQTYRGLMPESLVGLVAGQSLVTYGAAFEQWFPTRTYLTIDAEQDESESDRGFGAFVWDPALGAYQPTTLGESLSFRERTLSITADQLVGEDFALDANYRLSEAELDTTLANVHGGASSQRAVLQQLTLGVRFNHPSGFFARWDSVWSHQSNQEAAASLPGDDFWQHNVWMGWRFFRRRAEVAIGLLNVTDQDYRLFPLNYYDETYRSRTLAVSARFNL